MSQDRCVVCNKPIVQKTLASVTSREEMLRQLKTMGDKAVTCAECGAEFCATCAVEAAKKLGKKNFHCPKCGEKVKPDFVGSGANSAAPAVTAAPLDDKPEIPLGADPADATLEPVPLAPAEPAPVSAPSLSPAAAPPPAAVRRPVRVPATLAMEPERDAGPAIFVLLLGALAVFAYWYFHR